MVPPDPDDCENEANDDDEEQELSDGGSLESPARGPRHRRLATPSLHGQRYCDNGTTMRYGESRCSQTVTPLGSDWQVTFKFELAF